MFQDQIQKRPKETFKYLLSTKLILDAANSLRNPKNPICGGWLEYLDYSLFDLQLNLLIRQEGAEISCVVELISYWMIIKQKKKWVWSITIGSRKPALLTLLLLPLILILKWKFYFKFHFWHPILTFDFIFVVKL